jgi:MarR family transcriptional regulator for hemolysin
MRTGKKSLAPENSPGFLIHLLDTQMKLGLQRTFKMKGHDFTAEQWGVLSRLWQVEGLHQSELAAKVGKDRHNMTRMLDLLERRGYIRRKPDRNDKRRYNIYLTDEGKLLRKVLTPIVFEFLQKALAGMSSEELGEMRRMHRHIIGNIERMFQ